MLEVLHPAPPFWQGTTEASQLLAPMPPQRCPGLKESVAPPNGSPYLVSPTAPDLTELLAGLKSIVPAPVERALSVPAWDTSGPLLSLQASVSENVPCRMSSTALGNGSSAESSVPERCWCRIPLRCHSLSYRAWCTLHQRAGCQVGTRLRADCCLHKEVFKS